MSLDLEGRNYLWLERYLDGDTLQSIGTDYGVTREIVRQVTTRLWREMGYEGSPRYVGGLQERARRNREASDLAELRRRAEVAVPCIVCGCWVLRLARGHQGEVRTCSHACAEAWAAVRLQHPDYRHRHMRACAESWLRSTKASPAMKRWAQRFLAGEVDSYPRSHHEGSRASRVVNAFRPDLLPPPMKGQQRRLKVSA